MKKIIAVLILITVLVLPLCTLSACNAKEEMILVMDGDVVGNIVEINLSNIKMKKYSYEQEDKTIKTKGWHIADVINKEDYLYPDSYLMLTSASDGVSAVIEGSITGTIYFYYNDEQELCAKSIDYPRVCSIKNIAEITVVAKEPESKGYKILSPSETEYISRGNAKLKLYEKMAENYSGDNLAYKYTIKSDNSVCAFTEYEDNTVYFTDYDIELSTDFKELIWENGGLHLELGENKKQVFGFATGTHLMIYDAYREMKESLDRDEKVMFILPDGFSWEQANYFASSLDTLKPSNAKLALSVHLSITPVALATLVTGETPGVNGVHFDEGQSRAVLKPVVPDIFEYALSLGKNVSYLEGNGNLIVSSVAPVYALSDAEIYENAKTAITEGKDLIFVHFHDPDDTNHEYGPLSTQSMTKIAYIESYIEYLISQFDGKVIVVPDHGHNTLYDTENKPYGKHGMFTNLDMYVPFYIFNVD